MRCAPSPGVGSEPPSGSAARLTARAFSRGNLESARATGLAGGNLAAELIENCFVLEASLRAGRRRTGRVVRNRCYRR